MNYNSEPHQDHGYQPPQHQPAYVPPGFNPAQQGPMAYGGGFGHQGHPGQPPIVSQPQTNDGEYRSSCIIVDTKVSVMKIHKTKRMLKKLLVGSTLNFLKEISAHNYTRIRIIVCKHLKNCNKLSTIEEINMRMNATRNSEMN